LDYPWLLLGFVARSYTSILFVIAMGLVQNRLIPARHFWWFYGLAFAGFSALTALFYYFGINFRYNVAVIALAVLGLESFYHFVRHRPGRYYVFLVCMALVGFGNVFSTMDLQRVWCNPAAKWFFGHAIWHLLTALGLGISILHWEKAYSCRKIGK